MVASQPILSDDSKNRKTKRKREKKTHNGDNLFELSAETALQNFDCVNHFSDGYEKCIAVCESTRAANMKLKRHGHGHENWNW